VKGVFKMRDFRSGEILSHFWGGLLLNGGICLVAIDSHASLRTLKAVNTASSEQKCLGLLFFSLMEMYK